MRYLARAAIVGATIVLASNLHAQAAATEKLPTYRFNAAVPVYECDFQGEPASGDRTETLDAPVNAQFFYIREVPVEDDGAEPDGSVVVLQFLNWVRDPVKRAAFNESRERGVAGRKTFCVDKTIFDLTTERTYDKGWSSWDLAAGVMLLPIKMRPGGDGRGFAFSRDVTIGTVAGPRWRLSATRDLFMSLVGGAGIAAVSLDSASTAGKVKETTDRAAVALALGTMVEVNRFQIGLLFGWDRISDPNQNDWIYQGKRWISLGLGYSLLRAPADSPSRDQ